MNPEKAFPTEAQKAEFLSLICQPGGQIQAVSKQAMFILGYSQPELLELSLSDLIAASDYEAFLKWFEASLAAQTDAQHFLLLTKKGAKTPMVCQLQVLLNPQGEQLLFEAKIPSRQQARLQELLDLLPIPVMVTDLGVTKAIMSSPILCVNQAFSEKTGYQLEEISTVEAWTHKAYPDPEYRQHVVSSSTGKLNQMDPRISRFYLQAIWVQTKEGGRILMERYSTVYHNQLVTCYYDLTQAYETEMALRTAEANSRQFLDAMPLGVSIMDKSNQLVYVNQKAVELQGKGLDPESDGDLAEVYQAYIRGTDQLYPLERMPLVRAMQGESIVVDDMEIRQPARNVPVQVWGSPVYDEQGEVSCAIVAFSDITERLRYLDRLQDAKIMAEASSRVKSEFLANMSHEIRTPMSAIIGLNHLLEKTILTPKQRDYVRKIQVSARNLLRIINDILDFSKIEAGKLELEFAPFDLEQVLANLSALLSLKANEKGLELAFDLRENVPDLLIGDSLRLEQILLNLVNNAIKFTESGSVIVAVRVEEQDEAEALLKFCVQDTGIGMNLAQQERLFHAFGQADTSITRQFGGTGLGLTISKHLAEVMGGQIGVESKLGKGSTFWFTARFTKQIEHIQKQLVNADIRGLNALVVDDQPQVQEIISGYLSAFGMNVQTAESGKGALKLLAQEPLNPIQLVLLDWKMPGMDGVETLDHIRKDLTDQPAVILMTAYGREDLLLKLDQAPVEGILLKPLTPSMVYDAILEALKLSPEIVELPQQQNSFWRELLQPFYGMKLLVVEDNSINQQVAQELLEAEGFQVQIAQHGQHAIELLEQSDYQLVLMDLQMPVMDGYTATRKIRQDQRWAGLPIIAMTADAVTGVREQVLAAGMNDCVTKPIDIDELFNKLIHWLPPGQKMLLNARSRANESEPQMHFMLPQIPGLDVVRALKRVSGNQIFYLKLLAEFAQSYQDFGLHCRGLLASGQYEELYRYIHTLTGAAGNLGMTQIYQLSRQLEARLKQENPPESAFEEIYQAMTHILRQLEHIVIDNRRQVVQNTQAKLNIADLEAFEARLELYDPAAQKLLEQLEGLPLETYDALQAALNQFDFERALEIVSDLIKDLMQEENDG